MEKQLTVQHLIQTCPKFIFEQKLSNFYLINVNFTLLNNLNINVKNYLEIKPSTCFLKPMHSTWFILS